jgi:hypothetical protein
MTKEGAFAKYYASEVCVQMLQKLFKYLVDMATQKISRLKNTTAIVNYVQLVKEPLKFKNW